LKPTNNALQVFFIYADNCRDCDKILAWIEEISAESKIPLQLLRFRYDEKAALNIAVQHDIDDLPGIVIGKTKDVFQGKKVSQSQLKSAIIKAWKSIGEPKSTTPSLMHPINRASMEEAGTDGYISRGTMLWLNDRGELVREAGSMGASNGVS